MDELKPVLGPPVEPPDDVWATALAGAFDDPRDPGELSVLVPAAAETADVGGEWEQPDGDPDPLFFDGIDEPIENISDQIPEEHPDAIEASGNDLPDGDPGAAGWLE